MYKTIAPHIETIVWGGQIHVYILYDQGNICTKSLYSTIKPFACIQTYAYTSILNGQDNDLYKTIV